MPREIMNVFFADDGEDKNYENCGNEVVDKLVKCILYKCDCFALFSRESLIRIGYYVRLMTFIIHFTPQLIPIKFNAHLPAYRQQIF